MSENSQQKNKHLCVILSGCGFLDGAEIHEAVCSLLYISQNGATYEIAAPNKDQHHVVNHHTGEESQETRNIRIEAARIARGPVKDLSEVQADDYDALFIPGGFGAAKNLSTFAFQGPKGSIDDQVKRVINDFHNQEKPIGAVCIAPAVLALALGKGKVTIGTDQGTADAIELLGGTHENCPVTKAVIDTENKLVTSPAYMADAPIHEVATGIEQAVISVLNLC
jgi:enhancing lycopene biosynthesis protein 2